MRARERSPHVQRLLDAPRITSLRCRECGNRGFVLIDRHGVVIDACPDCTGRAEALWRRHFIVRTGVHARFRGGASLRQGAGV